MKVLWILWVSGLYEEVGGLNQAEQNSDRKILKYAQWEG